MRIGPRTWPTRATATVESLEARTHLSAPVKVLPVPAYTYWYGCAPTAMGMIMGYYDSHGFPNVIPGNASSLTQNVKDAIAGPDHRLAGVENHTGWGDWHNCPSLPQHEQHPTSLADYIKTRNASTNSAYFPGLLRYLASRGQSGWTMRQVYHWTMSWNDVVASIDAGHPVLAVVDTSGDGHMDHVMPIVGYNRATGQYAAYDDSDTQLHWFTFAAERAGLPFGIAQVAFITPPRPKVRLVTAKTTATEDGSQVGLMRISRVTGPDAAVTVGLSISGTAINGVDTDPVPQTVTIPAGQTSVLLQIKARRDSQPEGPEALIVTLAPGKDYDLGPAVWGKVTIEDAPTLA